MTLHIRIFSVCLVAAAIALHVPALAEPVKGSSTGERPLGDAGQHAPPKAATYGLCSGPQNADAFPSSPVPVQHNQCDNSQQFSATSSTPSTGGSCGGFTVAFGQLGDLKPYLNKVMLTAAWGDVPLTATNCASARLAAVGWGERCSDEDCTSAQWEKLGGPQQRKGTWNATKQACNPGVVIFFGVAKEKYKTLNLDIITTVVENGKTVRQRAKGTIKVWRGNGKCPTATYKPS
jgi:hypothetical protein